MRREAGDPDLPVMFSETGWTKGVYHRYPTTSGETFSVSPNGTPRYDGLDAFKSQGISILRGFLHSTATDMWADYAYQLLDDQNYKDSVIAPDGINYDGIDASNGWINLRDTTARWPVYFMMAGLSKRFGRYHCIDTPSIGGPGGLWVLKYRHIIESDSVLYVVWKGDTTTGAGIAYSIPAPLASVANVYTPSYTQVDYTFANAPIIAGSISVTATVIPKFYNFRETLAPVGPQGTPYIWRKKRRVKNGEP